MTRDQLEVFRSTVCGGGKLPDTTIVWFIDEISVLTREKETMKGEIQELREELHRVKNLMGESP